MTELSVRAARKSEADIVAELLQDYLAEFATFDDVEQDEDGRYRYPYLSHYWEDPNRYPFLFRDGDDVSGFALLRFEADPVSGREAMEIAEFYVAPAFRRRGVATAAARYLWDLFPGRWIVRVLKTNKPAYPFWKQAISEYTGSRFDEQPPGGIFGGFYTFTFESRASRDMPENIDIEPDF